MPISAVGPDRDGIEAESGPDTADAIQLLWLLAQLRSPTVALLERVVSSRNDRGVVFGSETAEPTDIGADTNPSVTVGQLPNAGTSFLSTTTLRPVGFNLGPLYGGQWAFALGNDNVTAASSSMGVVDMTALKVVLRFWKHAFYGSGTYLIAPDRTHADNANIYLGYRSSSNHRFEEVAANTVYAHAGIQERSRTVNAGEWQSFSPTWTGSGSNPAIENGAITGSYTLIGKTCFFQINVVMGSTTTYGTGTWSFSLPIAEQAVNDVVTGGNVVLAYDSSVTTHFPGFIRLSGSQKCAAMTTAGVVFTSAVPFTWATSDQLGISGSYEID